MGGLLSALLAGTRTVMEGGTANLVAGTLGLGCLLLDLGWTQPALPNAWDPPEQDAASQLLISAVTVLFVYSSLPAAIVYWKFVKAGTLLRALQLALGSLTLLLVYRRDKDEEDIYCEEAWHGAHWKGTRFLLVIALLFCGTGYVFSLPPEGLQITQSLVAFVTSLVRDIARTLTPLLGPWTTNQSHQPLGSLQRPLLSETTQTTHPATTSASSSSAAAAASTSTPTPTSRSVDDREQWLQQRQQAETDAGCVSEPDIVLEHENDIEREPEPEPEPEPVPEPEPEHEPEHEPESEPEEAPTNQERDETMLTLLNDEDTNALLFDGGELPRGAQIPPLVAPRAQRERPHYTAGAMAACCRATHAPLVFGCGAYVLALSVCTMSLMMSFYSFEPNTSCYGWLNDQRESSLAFHPNVTEEGATQTYPIGCFLELSVSKDQLIVQDTRYLENYVWKSVAGEAFLRVGSGSLEAWALGKVVSFVDTVNWSSQMQTIDRIRPTEAGVRVEGSLFSTAERQNRQFKYVATMQGTPCTKSDHTAGEFVLNATVSAGLIGESTATRHLETSLSSANREDIGRVYLTHSRSPEEAFFGFGTQLSHSFFTTACIPIVSREKGFGRGLQPFTFLMNRFNREIGGSWQNSPTAIPMYLSSQGRAMSVDGDGLTVFDLTQPHAVTVEIVTTAALSICTKFAGIGVHDRPNSDSHKSASASAKRDTLQAETAVEQPSNNTGVQAVRPFFDKPNPWPQRLLTQTLPHIGRPAALPSWVGEGLVVHANKGEENVLRIVNKFVQGNVTIVAVMIDDWAGAAWTDYGSIPVWGVEPCNNLYPNWDGMIATLEKVVPGIKILIHFSPNISRYTGADPSTGESELFRDALKQDCLAEIGRKNDLYLRTADPSGRMEFGTVQLLLEHCRDWYATRLRRAIQRVGADGWLSTHGEDMPLSATIDGVEVGSKGHNTFVRMWVKTNDLALPLSAHSNKLVLHNTAALNDEHGLTLPRVQSMGSQLSSWDAHDGLASALRGILSSALSGLPASSSFLGGVYNSAHTLGVIRFQRSRELLLRWAELSVFSDAALVSHRGRSLSDVPIQVAQLEADETIETTASLVGLFKILWPYKQLVMQTDAPLVRPMWFSYPNLANVLAISNRQFMLGPDMVVCPVLRDGATEVACLLPPGRWHRMQQLDNFVTTSLGQQVTCYAPLGLPCAFVRAGTRLYSDIEQAL